MLKAYDYIDFSPKLESLYDSEDLEKELKIAEVAARKCSNGEVKTVSCPICGSTDVPLYFRKWGVDYLKCNECESVFANTKNDITTYINDSELRKYRTSKEYQNKASQKRQLMWEETLDWIKFRTYRYTGSCKEKVIVDYGNRYEGFVNIIKTSSVTGEYHLKNSILNEDYVGEYSGFNEADLILLLDVIQQSNDIRGIVKEVHETLKQGGLVFISTRIGTGFDILTLKEHSKIFPYDHVLLPSMRALCSILDEVGFEVLEQYTPGAMDIAYVKNKIDMIADGEEFVKSIIKKEDASILGEFQRFLQKSEMSSYARIVARKK